MFENPYCDISFSYNIDDDIKQAATFRFMLTLHLKFFAFVTIAIHIKFLIVFNDKIHYFIVYIFDIIH